MHAAWNLKKNHIFEFKVDDPLKNPTLSLFLIKQK